MRIAVLIIALILMFVLGAQSCAVAVGGGLGSGREAEDLSAGGAFGLLAALLWLIGAGLVLAKPKASVWLFGVAVLVCLFGGSTGFDELFFWAIASAILAVMSFFGVRERQRKDEAERARYRADVEAAAASHGGMPPPQGQPQTPSPPGSAPPPQGQPQTPPPPGSAPRQGQG